jgi:predicted GNAT superfamily acetyltransferase
MSVVITPLLRFDSFRMSGLSIAALSQLAKVASGAQDADVISISAIFFCERLSRFWRVERILSASRQRQGGPRL